MEQISEIPLYASTEGLLCWKKKLYVTLPDENAVGVIDTMKNKVLKLIEVGPAPASLTKCKGDSICVDNKGEHYVD